ncbi:MAG TPA: hypothetical protein VMJ10_05150 [Kofleriaceae bacterium]|nr:hypothetical protein [Kofleriaceae bacterium]
MTREALALALVLAACGSKSHATADAAVDAFAGCPANCDPHSQYCFQYAIGALPDPGCVALPTSCMSAPTCACIEATLSSPSSCITCAGTAATGFVVTCGEP